ncbi:MAG: tannase/feruloyl esterase family alpha/beta hydrolase [Candidatus Neomarinimicrobiota bacterium]
MQRIKVLLFIPLALIWSNIVLAQTSEESHTNYCLQCEEIKNLRLPDVTINQTELIQEPTPHCKVLGTIGSEIDFELLLPNDWNSRFIMGGGSGFAGSIINLARPSINDGYATSGTNTGHTSHVLKADWALNNIERQLNFGHLAVHRTAVVSKEIIRQYYCSEIAYSYFWGCSRGGGQAMMEAQRYPEDFDGIVAGAPAFNWIAFGAKNIQNSQVLFPNPEELGESIITLANIELLYSHILEQCDQLDGLKDSILNDPRDCDFDFNQLPRCKIDVPSEDCFTSKQIEAIKVLYSTLSIDDNEIYPGSTFGCENEEMGWQNWITGPTTTPLALDFPSLQFGFGTEIYKNLIFQDTDWDYSTYDFTDFSKTTQYASSYLDATSLDYSDFKNQGSKLIIYHGWNDHGLSPLSTIDHYELVENFDADIRDYFRLFLLPGILHCAGGPGPGQIDWVEIISNWVENNKVPERIVMSKLKNGNVVMTRPVFPYPEKALYNGIGDPNLESSFIKDE